MDPAYFMDLDHYEDGVSVSGVHYYIAEHGESSYKNDNSTWEWRQLNGVENRTGHDIEDASLVEEVSFIHAKVVVHPMRHRLSPNAPPDVLYVCRRDSIGKPDLAFCFPDIHYEPSGGPHVPISRPCEGHRPG